jgi:hypothetical protein
MKELSSKGVVLRCSSCKNEQKLDTGNAMGTADANFLLCMMTGGHYGVPPFPYRKTEPGDGSLIGRSLCCDKQIEGELYGYEDA